MWPGVASTSNRLAHAELVAWRTWTSAHGAPPARRRRRCSRCAARRTPAAGDVVGVHVRLEDVGERRARARATKLQVALDLLEHRVDEHAPGAWPVGDEIGVRRGLGVEELAENHHAEESHEPAQTIHRPAHEMQASRPRELSAARLVSVQPVSAHTFLHRALASLPTLRRVGRRLTGDSAEADDLVQETLIRALERRDELRDPERLQR